MGDKQQAVADKKRVLKRYARRFGVSLAVTVLLCVAFSALAYAAAAPQVTIDLAAGDGSGGTFGAFEIMFMLVIISLAPSILIMMTSFLRIIIVLSFLRNALGMQQTPPNQVLVGMALFLTLFIMMPVLNQISTDAYEPFREGSITQEEAVDRAIVPLKRFMAAQTTSKSLSLFLTIAKDRAGGAEEMPDPQAVIDAAVEDPESLLGLGLEIILPAFITSEITRAFEMGFLLFIPFLIIDMVVSSTLMSMGMVMLPPSMIALPFKIMMFVIVNGWGLLFETLVKSFRVV